MKLQTKLVAALTGLAVVVTLLPGSWMVWETFGALRTQAQQGQLALARSLAAQVDQGMSQVVRAMEALSRRRDVVKLEKQGLQQALALVSSATDLFDALAVVLPDGRIQAVRSGGAEPRNLPSARTLRDWVAQARQAKEPILSDVTPTASGELSVNLAVPLFRRGHMVGLLLGVLPLSSLGTGNLEEMRIGRTGAATLVNEKGQPIERAGGAPVIPAIASLLGQAEGLAEYVEPAGRPVLAAYARVESVSWGVVVRQSLDECYAPADRMLRFLLLSLAAVVVASALLAMILARRLVRPLQRLAEEVRRLQSGSLDPGPLAGWKTDDEVGMVAHSLAGMAQALKSQQQERERAYARALAAEKKLAESERLAALGQLSAGLAHELNNPLAVILGSAQEASQVSSSGGGAAAPWLDRIQREAKRCQGLVRDLLDFARPVRLKRRQTDLAEVARQAFEQARQGRPAPAELSLPSDSPLARAWVDPDRFKQVFINLFTNALESMPAGGKVELAFKQAGGRSLIACRDFGQGLPKGNPDLCFRPFFTTKTGGTGLGLAICRSILKAHGGDITAHRPRGKGALFVMEVPEA